MTDVLARPTEGQPARRSWNAFAVPSFIAEILIVPIVLIFGAHSYTSGSKVVRVPALSTALGIENLVTGSVMCLLFGGIILGHVALLKRYRSSRGTGFAIAGIAIGYSFLGLLLTVIILAAGFVLLSGALK